MSLGDRASNSISPHLSVHVTPKRQCSEATDSAGNYFTQSPHETMAFNSSIDLLAERYSLAAFGLRPPVERVCYVHVLYIHLA
jgi:hypothetical protein